MGNYCSSCHMGKSLEMKLCEDCAEEHRDNWSQNKRQSFTSWGSEPIAYLAFQGHTHCLKVLLEARVMKDKKKNNWKRICNVVLIYAVCHSHDECMEFLIDVGADVYIPFKEPLLITARNGYAKCLELLIRKGANVNRPLVCREGNSVFSIWVSTALREASKYNHTACVELLLKSGAHVNSNTILPLIIDVVSTYSDHTLSLC